jgi:hypothetical protein
VTDRRHKDFDGAEMHNEDDQARMSYRSEKPRYDQVRPIAGPEGASGTPKGADSAEACQAETKPLCSR